MCIYHCSQCLMSTFQYLFWSTCSVQSLVVPTGGMVFLLIQICSSLKSLYLVNEITTVAEVFKEFAQQQIEGCSDFIYCEDLRQHFLWVLCCFGNFWTVSDIVFKDDILPTCDFFDLSDKLDSQARPYPFHSTGCILDTGSNWCCGKEKVWLVRLSQQFISISKSRCSLFQTSLNEWYKGD